MKIKEKYGETYRARFLKEMQEQIHSTNEEIIQAKKRGTTSTEIGKIKEKMGLGTKKSLWGLGSNREVSFLIVFFCN